MPLRPNTLSSSMAESVTLAISAKAKRLRAEGLDVISLSAGEPDFGTMEPIAQAGIEAIRSGQTRYTAASGIPELRAAGAEWLHREFGLDYQASEVIATAGVKPALHFALMAIVEPGDTVLLPAPYWVSYPSLVQISGGTSVDVEAVPEQGFIHTGEQLLRAARDHDAKGVILNFPNNPSGAAPTEEQVQDLVAAAVESDMWIISDEIYASMLYDGRKHYSPASYVRDRTIVVNGPSKSHSMTGWRLGFLAGPEDIVKSAAKLQSQALGNPCTISQFAGLVAFTMDFRYEQASRLDAFDDRRHFLVRSLNELDGVSARMPEGAFYVMADVRELCGRLGVDDVGLADKLLDDARIAVVPGTPFAIPGFIRLSYAASMDQLEQAIGRLREFVAS